VKASYGEMFLLLALSQTFVVFFKNKNKMCIQSFKSASNFLIFATSIDRFATAVASSAFCSR